MKTHKQVKASWDKGDNRYFLVKEKMVVAGPIRARELEREVLDGAAIEFESEADMDAKSVYRQAQEMSEKLASQRKAAILRLKIQGKRYLMCFKHSVTAEFEREKIRQLVLFAIEMGILGQRKGGE